MAAALQETDDDNFLDRRKQWLCWVKLWLEEKSLGVHLLYKLERDTGENKRLLRVSHDAFLQLLARTESWLQKQNTNMRCPMSPATRLKLIFCYLACGTYIFFTNRHEIHHISKCQSYSI